MPKKIFSYEDASALLPEVQRLTEVAVNAAGDLADDTVATEDVQRIVQDWAQEVMSLGIEVKGLWLVDFDNGSGYYCWKWPEE